MNRATKNNATARQQDEIRRLLRQAEYGLDTVAAPHKALAKRAGVPPPFAGISVNGWLSNLHWREASRIALSLIRETQEIPNAL